MRTLGAVDQSTASRIMPQPSAVYSKGATTEASPRRKASVSANWPTVPVTATSASKGQSARSTGTTSGDGSFDIDGGSGTLAYYGGLGKGFGERRTLLSGDGVQLGKSEAFFGRHVLVPRHGVAVCINAFNFPVWGFAEKAACALLAGMPVIVKPATSTAWLTERAIEILIEKNILPEGALQLVVGSTGDLLDRLGPQDVLAFTGSAATANSLRNRPNLFEESVRTNVEADSLNAATLGPDVSPGSPAWELFVRDVVREMTQKSGQKCTAVRRILAPRERIAEVEAALAAALGKVVTGNPVGPATTMGPLATSQQLRDSVAGVAALGREARLVTGNGQRIDGNGSPQGKGYFLAPTLLRADDARSARAIHEREVFAPVATLLPYDGAPADAAAIVGLGGGTLVGSVYTDDAAWLGDFFAVAATTTGRPLRRRMRAMSSSTGVMPSRASTVNTRRSASSIACMIWARMAATRSSVESGSKPPVSTAVPCQRSNATVP